MICQHRFVKTARLSNTKIEYTCAYCGDKWDSDVYEYSNSSKWFCPECESTKNNR